MSGNWKPSISPSQMDMFFKCGEQWRRRYVLGEKIPPGFLLVRGGAVHKAAEVNFSQKIESHEDLKREDLQAVAAAHVDSTIAAEGLTLGEDEASRGMEKVRGALVDRAVEITGLYRDKIAPPIQPVLVEQFVRIELPGRPYDLNGRLDLVDDQQQIRDIKVSNRRKGQAEVDSSDQLTYYYVAHAKLTGHRPERVVLDVLVDKARPEVQTLRSTRDESDKQVFLNRLNAMLRGIQAGDFRPAPLGQWYCSPRFCGYWHTCPYVNSQRKAAAEAIDFGGALE